MNKYLKLTIAISNVFFWLCIGFGMYFWLQNRQVKSEADVQYANMMDAFERCSDLSDRANPACAIVTTSRKHLDQLVLSSGRYSSLTRLFIAFGVFIPLVTWASFFLTRAIFY